MNYYGAFFRSMLYPLLWRINAYLVRWARRKYRRIASFKRVKKWWFSLCDRAPGLFAHWRRTRTFEWIRSYERCESRFMPFCGIPGVRFPRATRLKQARIDRGEQEGLSTEERTRLRELE